MKRKYIGIALIVIGLTVIGTALFMRFSGKQKQDSLIKDFQARAEEFQKMGQGAVSDKSPDLKPPSQEISGAIGLMIIPKINLKVAIGEGVDNETLKYAVGHFSGTALPGQKGNFCVAGHRSYTYNDYFNRLDELQNGDEIIVKTIEGEYKYKVVGKKVVEPTEVSVLDTTKEATMTLVTCTPVRVATHRLIISGELIK